jgi:hypothetical protein
LVEAILRTELAFINPPSQSVAPGWQLLSLPGPSYLSQIAKAIGACEVILLVASRHSITSEQVTSEIVRGFEQTKPFLPVLRGISHVQLQRKQPEWRGALGAATSIEVPPEGLGAILPRILAGVEALGVLPQPLAEAQQSKDPDRTETTSAASDTAGLRLVLLYKRNVQPDELLLQRLEADFLARGADVFIDRNLTIGEDWGKELERRVRDADAVIVLLSAASIHSEMLAYEVQIAHEEAQRPERHGKPRLLPVRVNFEDPPAGAGNHP